MTMKKAIFILSAAIAVFVSACGNSGETDKQGQLASLKEQREALDEQIKTLEAEVMVDNPELDQRKVYNVTIDTIQPQAFEHYIQVQGAVESDDNINMRDETPGDRQSVVLGESEVVRVDHGGRGNDK